MNLAGEAYRGERSHPRTVLFALLERKRRELRKAAKNAADRYRLEVQIEALEEAVQCIDAGSILPVDAE